MERVSLKPCRMREYIGQWPKDRKFFLGEVFREKNTFVFLKKNSKTCPGNTQHFMLEISESGLKTKDRAHQTRQLALSKAN